MIKERIHLRIFNRIVGETFNEGTEHLADDSLESGLIYLKKTFIAYCCFILICSKR